MSQGAGNPTQSSESNSQLAAMPEGLLLKLYTELLSALDKLKQRATAGEDAQVICFEAIWQVRKFLDVNPEVEAAGLTQPLGLILAGLNDVRGGSLPKLFEVRKNPDPDGGRPKGTARITVLRAVAAACLELLIDAEVPRTEAEAFVLKELNKAGYVKSGKGEITAQTVKGWRDDMGGTIDGADLNIFRKIVKEVRDGLGDQFGAVKVRQQIKEIIAGMQHEGIPRE
jgi:hypothetical protein